MWEIVHPGVACAVLCCRSRRMLWPKVICDLLFDCKCFRLTFAARDIAGVAGAT